MTFDNLLLERDGAVAILTFNRPKVLNALNAATLGELETALRALQSDDEVRAIVLSGAGEKAFVAGADINELAVLTPAQGKEHARHGQRIFDLIEQLGKPVIAAINGFALGGGCELAMACTLRVAADTARLGQPEINLGIIPGYGGSQRLPRLVGKGRALEILLTGDMVSAQRAYEIGLVNQVVPAAELMAAARTLAATLAGKAPIATRYILEAVNQGLDMPLAQAQFLETALFGAIASTEDTREGTSAFLEKRKATWKGR
ncbi:MAG: enoyl-CoA hydratase/isomerase family protein [Acidobacteria bacterium]|nr:enoyl-CoA hydratase/isomerase family protein [Acidobacteriota bacterium]